MTHIQDISRVHAVKVEGLREVPPSRWRIIGNLPKSAIAVLPITTLALIAYIDYITDPEISFACFYVFPVLLAAWFQGRTIGYVMAAVSAGAWLLTQRMAPPSANEHPPAVAYAYWNTLIMFCFFVAAVMLLSDFKNLSTRLEALVEERTTTLRRLASQLSEAEDSQRRRLAYDIHDGFSQILTVLKLNLAATLPQTPEGSPQRQRIADALGMVDELIDRSRTLTFDLHPAMLDHFGLTPTLRAFAEQFGRRANVEILISQDGDSRALPAPLANYLFRSIKELLNNAAKHGKARQIVAGVHWVPTLLRIVVDDDGCGFDPTHVFSPGVVKGLGLAGIRERMLSLGGKFRIESSAGQGTRVVLELPVESQEKIE